MAGRAGGRFKWDETRSYLTEDAAARYQWKAGNGVVSLTRTDRENRTSQVDYDVVKEVLTTTAPDGTRSTVAYQRRAAGKGLLREQRGADGLLLTKIDYNDRHLPVRLRKLGEPVLRQVYDERDRLTEVWRSPAEALEGKAEVGAVAGATGTTTEELVTRLTYEGGNRNPTTSTDALGQTTRFAYDAYGQVVQITRPGGAVVRQKYEPWGRLVQRDLPEGVIELIKYDVHGRVTERKAGDGSVSSVDYDRQGRVRQRTEAGAVYTHRYDEAGRPLEVQRNQKPWLKWAYGQASLAPVQPQKAPANWVADPKALKVNTVTFTDPLGQVTTRCFDEDGNLVEETNALGERTRYYYNRVGEAVGWIDARGHALLFKRDVAGRIVRQENALGQVLTWRFDAAGRLAERSSREQRAKYAFDVAGRLESIDYGLGQVVRYERDGLGRLLSATTGEVATTYRYDALDRPEQVEQRPREGAPSGLVYGYSVQGQKDRVTVLKPDSVGRLVAASTTITLHDGLGRV